MIRSHKSMLGKKGFALFFAIIFVSILMVVSGSIFTLYMNSKTSVEGAYAELQATDLAIEGVEMMKGYMMTETNRDRQDGYRNKIAPLSGRYTVAYDVANGYTVSQASDPEEISIIDPVVQTFKRTITVSTIGPDEKKIVSEVQFGNHKTIQLTLSHANFYGN